MTITKILAGLALSTALVGAASANDIALPSGTYQLDPTHGSLFWTVNHFGLSNYTARINRFDASVELDAEDITQSTLTATIDLTTLDTDYPFPEQADFNAELQNADWLNTEVFPQATFVSTQIVKTGDTTAEITGDLTFLGQTLPVMLDATLVGFLEQHLMVEAPAFGIQATGTFDRSEFGLTTFAPMVGTDVTITINAEFIGENLSSDPS